MRQRNVVDCATSHVSKTILQHLPICLPITLKGFPTMKKPLTRKPKQNPMGVGCYACTPLGQCLQDCRVYAATGPCTISTLISCLGNTAKRSMILSERLTIPPVRKIMLTADSRHIRNLKMRCPMALKSLLWKHGSLHVRTP